MPPPAPTILPPPILMSPPPGTLQSDGSVQNNNGGTITAGADTVIPPPTTPAAGAGGDPGQILRPESAGHLHLAHRLHRGDRSLRHRHRHRHAQRGPPASGAIQIAYPTTATAGPPHQRQCRWAILAIADLRHAGCRRHAHPATRRQQQRQQCLAHGQHSGTARATPPPARCSRRSSGSARARRQCAAGATALHRDREPGDLGHHQSADSRAACPPTSRRCR